MKYKSWYNLHWSEPDQAPQLWKMFEMVLLWCFYCAVHMQLQHTICPECCTLNCKSTWTLHWFMHSCSTLQCQNLKLIHN